MPCKTWLHFILLHFFSVFLCRAAFTWNKRATCEHFHKFSTCISGTKKKKNKKNQIFVTVLLLSFIRLAADKAAGDRILALSLRLHLSASLCLYRYGLSSFSYYNIWCAVACYVLEKSLLSCILSADNRFISNSVVVHVTTAEIHALKVRMYAMHIPPIVRWRLFSVVHLYLPCHTERMHLSPGNKIFVARTPDRQMANGAAHRPAYECPD